MTGFPARYDLARRNISFDFYAWQTHAVILGANEIVFGTESFGHRSLPRKELEQRYRSIIKPGPALLGLPSREGIDGIECATHRFSGIIGTKRWDFPRLKSVLPARTDIRYTITLRNCPVHPERNSVNSIWKDFARRIGAYLIHDWHDRPLGLHERVALYAGAKMNFGVCNGPMGLLMFSPYPLMMWGCDLVARPWHKHGIDRGQQVPWLLPGQSLVWETPTMQGLMAAVEKIERQ